MPRYAQIEGVGTLEFPDDTPDAIIDAKVRDRVREHGREEVKAGQERKAAVAAPQTPADKILSPIESYLGYLGYEPTVPFSSPEFKGQAVRRGIEAGSTVGGMGGGVAAAKLGLRALPAALTRILSTAAGGEVGGEVAGAAPGTGALVGGAGAVVGETAAPLAGKVMRALPGSKGRIASGQAAKLGEQITRNVPDIPRANSSQELRSLAQDPRQGLTRLYDMMETAMGEIEQKIGGQLVNVPTLSDQPLPFAEAKRALSKLGQQGFGAGKADPFQRTVQGLDAREMYEQATAELSGELTRLDPTGGANKTFDLAREMYRKGMGYLNLLRGPRAFEGYPHEVQFNRPAAQRRYASKQGEYQKRLGPQAAGELEDLLYGGAPVGTVDRPISGSGHFLDAIRAYFGQTGARPRFLALLPQTLAPNIAAQYAGRPPYSVPPGLQTLLDILASGTLANAAP